MKKDEERVASDINDIYDAEKGKYFIAAKRNVPSVSYLSSFCSAYNDTKSKRSGEYIFTKIVNKRFRDITDPTFDEEKRILSVSSFNQYELERAVKTFQYQYPKSNRFVSKMIKNVEYVNLFNYMYETYGIDMYKMLSEYMHFCTVIYDCNNDCLIGGVSEPDNEFNRLFYGYSKADNEIAFSNHPALLRRFCNEVFKMPNNTFMKNGQLHSFKEKSEDEIEAKLKELLESDYGRRIIDELVTRKVNEILSKEEGFSRKLK